jgi:hypothetical protein
MNRKISLTIIASPITFVSYGQTYTNFIRAIYKYPENSDWLRQLTEAGR